MESVRRFHVFCHFGNVAKLPGVEHGPHDSRERLIARIPARSTTAPTVAVTRLSRGPLASSPKRPNRNPPSTAPGVQRNWAASGTRTVRVIRQATLAGSDSAAPQASVIPAPVGFSFSV